MHYTQKNEKINTQRTKNQHTKERKINTQKNEKSTHKRTKTRETLRDVVRRCETLWDVVRRKRLYHKESLFQRFLKRWRVVISCFYGFSDARNSRKSRNPAAGAGFRATRTIKETDFETLRDICETFYVSPGIPRLARVSEARQSRLLSGGVGKIFSPPTKNFLWTSPDNVSRCLASESQCWRGF